MWDNIEGSQIILCRVLDIYTGMGNGSFPLERAEIMNRDNERTRAAVADSSMPADDVPRDLDQLPAEPTKTLPESLADRTANILDIATASNVERIDVMISRLQDVRSALVKENTEVKLRIHASIELASRTEKLVNSIDSEFSLLLADRKRVIVGGSL